MVRIVTLDCCWGGKIRTGTEPPLGTRRRFKRDQLPATAGPSPRSGLVKIAARPGRERQFLLHTGPGTDSGPRRCPRPRRKRAESSRAARIDPRLQFERLPPVSAIPRRARALRSSPSLPYPPGVQLARPANRHSSLTLLAEAFWRLPFGGDVPQPTSGERRPADHRRPGARTGQATPPLWRAHAGPRPTVGSAYLREEAWLHFRSQNPCRQAVAYRGWCPVQPVGKRAPFSCASQSSP